MTYYLYMDDKILSRKLGATRREKTIKLMLKDYK